MHAEAAARLVLKMHHALSSYASPTRPLKHWLDASGYPVFGIGDFKVHVHFAGRKYPRDMIVIESPAGHDELVPDVRGSLHSDLIETLLLHYKRDQEGLEQLRALLRQPTPSTTS